MYVISGMHGDFSLNERIHIVSTLSPLSPSFVIHYSHHFQCVSRCIHETWEPSCGQKIISHSYSCYPKSCV